MVLLVGLGNPGTRHAGNRHNFGFLAVEAIADRHRLSPWRRRFGGETAEGELGGGRALLLKPLTYMNEAGRAVSEAVHFYKVPLSDVVVFHDELDLPMGRLRVKTGGGNAGHNGLRSISAHIANAYRRVRLGIGHPGAKELVERHVLSDFAKSERDLVSAVCDAIADAAEPLVKGDDATFQNRVHLALDAKGFAETPPRRQGVPRPA